MKYLVRFLSVTIPLGLGVLSIILFAGMKSLPSAKETSPRVTQVRVITLAPIPVVPRVFGYGSVRPTKEWRAVARVEGEILWASDNLENGLLAQAGEELVKIDPSGIELTLAQIDAQISAIDARDETVRINLETAEAELEISRADLARQRDLAARQELASRININSLKNQLILNEAERKVLVAQRNIAVRDLGFTIIEAPFAMRIGEVSAQTGQFVNRGQVLFAAEGIEAVEIATQFPIAHHILRHDGQFVSGLLVLPLRQ